MIEAAMPAADYTAIILAAGFGSRIAEITEDPKILLPIDGRPILHRHLAIFEELGIRNVVIVAGYRKRQVMDAAQPFADRLNIRFVDNDDYTRLGNGYSMYFGIQAAAGASLIFDGDLVYARDILERFVNDGHSNAVLVGPGSLGDIECAKTLKDADGFARMTVDKRAVTEDELARYKFAGEAIGVLKFDEERRRRLIQECEAFFADEGNLLKNWEHIMNRFLPAHDVWAHEEASEAFVEIDTPEDYEEACRQFGRSD
jgi:choline kinase